jgi:murein L,D-transpeptidase YcbB/YkuD
MLIRKGHTGEEVKQIQRELGIEDDGIFGPVTESAVMRFQLEEHLDIDGIVGPKTWAALFGLTTDIQESLDSQHGIVINHHILPLGQRQQGQNRNRVCLGWAIYI